MTHHGGVNFSAGACAAAAERRRPAGQRVGSSRTSVWPPRRRRHRGWVGRVAGGRRLCLRNGRAGRRLSRADLPFGLAPDLNGLVVIAQRRREGMAAVAVGDEIEILRLCGVERRLDGGSARVGNRRRRQSVDLVGIVGRARVDVGAREGAPERALAAGDAVDDRRIGLEPHLAPQPVHEDGGDPLAFVGAAGFLLNDRSEDQGLLDAVGTGGPAAACPKSRRCSGAGRPACAPGCRCAPCRVRSDRCRAAASLPAESR